MRTDTCSYSYSVPTHERVLLAEVRSQRHLPSRSDFNLPTIGMESELACRPGPYPVFQAIVLGKVGLR